MADVETVDLNAQVSHEVDGRVLTGVGVSSDALEATMDRHTAEPEEASAASQPPAAPNASQPTQTRGQRRFAELTREREEARREAAEAKRERDELRARLTAPPAASREPERAPQAAPAASATRTKPTEDEVGTKYQSYGDYVEDLADWKAEQRFAALDFDAHVRKGIEADRASRSFEDKVGQVFTHARETYPDFDTVVSSGPGQAVQLGPARINWLMNRPDASHVIYAIAKDGDLAHKLAAMPDLEFGIAVAAIAPAPVASPASTGPASVTVPAPYQPVGSGSRTASVPSSELPSKAGYDFDRSGYREKRAAERAGRR